MEATEKKRFDVLYQQHLRAMKLQGLRDEGMAARGHRRVDTHYDFSGGACPRSHPVTLGEIN